MFHSQSLLSRKGPLGTIWLAAFFYKRLKKQEIVRTNISSSVDKIIPYAGTSYRILGQLLLGIVRIFSKKVEILYHDCNETLGRMSKVINPDGRRRPSCKSNVVSHSRKARNVFPCETSHHGIVSSPQDETIEPIVSSVEALVAPLRSSKVIIPENLTLDSFVLEVPVEGGSIDAHQQVTDRGEVDDNWQPTTYEGGSSMRQQQHGAKIDPGFNSACFTPVRDILWDHMVDLNIEIDEMHTSSISKNGEEPKADLSDAKCLQSTEIRLTTGSIVVDDVQELQKESAQTTFSAEVHSDELPQVSTPSAKAKLVHGNTLREVALEDFQQQVDINISFPGKRHFEARTPSRTHRKLIEPCPPGPASPEFAVKTPAKREQHRMAGKRKGECLIDETIVLSNQTLRESIHASSGLILKRRKAMHTRLDIWRLYKFFDLGRAFEEPLIPHPSMDFCNHLAKKLLDSRMDTTTEVKKSDDVKDDSHSSSLERECSFHHDIAETSFCCIPGSGGSLESNDERSKEPLVAVNLDIEEQDMSSNQALRNQGGFSTRTRSVAQYLCKSFENKKMDQNQTLRLSKALEGKKKKASAIIFYETLVLKAWDCIDVTQEVPYADIIISANLKLYTI